MSAFIVSRTHIEALVSAYDSFNNKGLSLEDANRIGQTLWDENIRSVQHRYPTKPIEELPGLIGEMCQYVHNYMSPLRTPIGIIKACDCLEYQSCEHPEWEHSEAKQIVEEIRRLTISKLPGYDNAPWGL